MLDFYPDILVIAGKEYKCQVSVATGVVLMPYKEEPQVKEGDIIIHKTATQDIEIKAIEVSFRRIGTFNSSNKTPHMLTMKIAPVSEIGDSGSSETSASATSIASEGDGYIYEPIDLQDFVKQVADSSDNEAKEALRSLLLNPKASILLGARAAHLLRILNV